MHYLLDGQWIFRHDTASETEAVEWSRKLWRQPGVQGVRVLRTTTGVHKEALREGAAVAPGGGRG